MARRGRKSRGGGSRGGLGALGRPLIAVGGILGLALMGAGAATLSDRAPQIFPFQKYAAGFAVGGLPGVLGVVVRDVGAGMVTGGAGGSSGGVYY